MSFWEKIFYFVNCNFCRPSVSRNVPEPPKVKRAEPQSSGSKRKKMTQVTVCLLIYNYHSNINLVFVISICKLLSRFYIVLLI
jgi:hypothetical protein